jgi:hypothetical protein
MPAARMAAWRERAGACEAAACVPHMCEQGGPCQTRGVDIEVTGIDGRSVSGAPPVAYVYTLIGVPSAFSDKATKTRKAMV